jgi:acyl dehydratase
MDQRWHETAARTVSAERLASFARVVGESEPGPLVGERALPTYPIVLGWESQNAVIDAVVPPEVLVLHAEQTFEYHRPLVPGARVNCRSRLDSVQLKGSATLVTVLTELNDERGPVCTQRHTLFLPDHRGTPMGAAVSVGARPEPGPVLASRTDVIGAHLPDQYAMVSGDDYAIHLDDAFARSVGLPGRIVHGMCTFAIAARVAHDVAFEAGYPHLVHLGVRFAAPVVPGSTLATTVRGHLTGEHVTLDFESSCNGRPVLTRGRLVAGRERTSS